MTQLVPRPAAWHARLPTCAVLLALTAGALGAHAATLNLTVRDGDGNPLADAVALLDPASGAVAVQPMLGVEIAQARKRFQPRVTVITVGTQVAFPNFDTVRHHVYSFSPIKPFEIKLYAGVPGVPVRFDKPGIAVLGCNIHDRMAAWVVVSDTPWFARSDATGQARVDKLPPGHYRLRLWHPGLGPDVEPTTQAISVADTDLDRAVTLPIRAGEP